MESIKSLIADPSWWFTAVFVGIMASLLASYFRDWLSSILSRVSSSYKDYRTRKNIELDAFIEKVASDPFLISWQYSLLIYRTTMMVALMLMFISLPSLGSAFIEHPEFSMGIGINLEGLNLSKGKLLYWLSILPGIMGIRQAWVTLTTLRICHRAVTKYVAIQSKPNKEN